MLNKFFNLIALGLNSICNSVDKVFSGNHQRKAYLKQKKRQLLRVGKSHLTDRLKSKGPDIDAKKNIKKDWQKVIGKWD